MKGLLAGLGLGLAAFLVFLIVTAPARLVVPLLPEALQVVDLEGTVWSASARGVRVNDLDLGQVDWRLHALPLAWATLSAAVALNGGQIQGQGEIRYRPGLVRLEDTTLSVNGGLLSRLVEDLGITVGGSALELDLPLLAVTPDGPVAAQGVCLWRDARLNAPAAIELGEVHGVLRQDGDTATLQIRNQKAPLGVGGEISFGPEWVYAARIQLTPGPQAPEALRENLKLLGKADRRGRVVVEDTGQIPVAELGL